jgi:hypothetical protein
MWMLIKEGERVDIMRGGPGTVSSIPKKDVKNENSEICN